MIDSIYNEVLRDCVELHNPIEGKGPRGLMMVQALTHMKLSKTGTATYTLK